MHGVDNCVNVVSGPWPANVWGRPRYFSYSGQRADGTAWVDTEGTCLIDHTPGKVTRWDIYEDNGYLQCAEANLPPLK